MNVFKKERNWCECRLRDNKTKQIKQYFSYSALLSSNVLYKMASAEMCEM